jgi:hypothetical protein
MHLQLINIFDLSLATEYTLVYLPMSMKYQETILQETTDGLFNYLQTTDVRIKNHPMDLETWIFVSRNCLSLELNGLL